ncbi:pyridoxal phosphate-dependent aminotransferase [Thermohalobacter berrensis]|uniref:Aminotransferase n=1 Tax=Thermohalobacter berrensis TaxID=99594 RepID=A0A419SZ65_9FIRM|nr:pyridoxal phosphate-dependent aminotransferase [Thermohalobacter berrensis]RKD30557.1 aspartate aminotransferase [Thermohalobacter berrensis]
MLSERLKYITPSYTIAISSKVSELERKGVKILNLSIGEPDFLTPNSAKNEGIKAIENNKTKYDHPAGIIELKGKILEKLKRENNIEYEIDEIVVSSGAKHAITNTLLALLNYGEEVIIPVPYWVSYPEMVKLVGAKPVFVKTSKENDFKITPAQLEEHISPKTKGIIISNPSNPTGAIYSKGELEGIIEVCSKNNIYIIADEVYEKIRYIDNFVSIASISDKAKEVTITINGLSKSASMTGWRIGYSASTKEIAKAISTIQGHLVSHPSTISQWAAYGALNYSQEEMDKMVETYKKRRDKAKAMLSKIDGISFVNPEGAFYIFIDISKLKDKINFDDSFSIEFCNRLLESQRVAVVPGIAFGMDDYIRISYACDMDILVEAIRRMEDFIENY